ncbi:MAG TPA: hypothetical protein VHQ65_16895 [Thermoanaerobaculia bacterium]|nr:hypothetical protein [Thermoanaerobaculia bacterium]
MQPRLILFLFALLPGLAAPSVAAAIEVRLELRGRTAPGRGELVVWSASAPQEEAIYPLQESVEVAAPSGTARVTCRGVGLWCPEVRLTNEAATLPVFEAMTVSGRVTGSGAEAAPAAGVVQGVVRGTETAGRPIELRQDLTLADGRFRFTRPAGRARPPLRVSRGGTGVPVERSAAAAGSGHGHGAARHAAAALRRLAERLDP